jgi:hypothetical protein
MGGEPFSLNKEAKLMSIIAAALVLAATNLAASPDSNFFASADPTDIEAILEEFMDSDLQGEEIVLDDSLLIDMDSELLEEIDE